MSLARLFWLKQKPSGVQDRAKLLGNMTDAVNVGASGAPILSRPTFDLSGGHYIVTGGTQGLGLEIARQLKATGAGKLVLMARTRSKGEAAVAELSNDTCTAHFVEVDIADAVSLQAAAAASFEILGDRVDGLVNAAGTTERGNLMDYHRRGLRQAVRHQRPRAIPVDTGSCRALEGTKASWLLHREHQLPCGQGWRPLHHSLFRIEGCSQRVDHEQRC